MTFSWTKPQQIIDKLENLYGHHSGYQVLELAKYFHVAVRVMAYVLRMKGKKKNGPGLTLQELEAAKTVLYKRCQQECFPAEIIKIKSEQKISPKSRLLQLNPFLDKDGILRVGGRLQNAIISYTNKHPIILPYEHKTTRAIVEQMHLDTSYETLRC